jgi:hypothetical protein
MRIHISVRGMREWEQRFDEARNNAGRDFSAVVEKAAFNVKRDWRRSWAGFRHAPLVAASITYDLSRGAGWRAAEIGPDKDLPQGPLGNLIEFGSVNNPPHPGGLRAALREEPRFVRAAERAGEIGVGG